MASESRIKIVGQITSSPAGNTQINTSEIVNSDAPIGQTEVHLAMGDNTITVPGTTSGISRGVIIIPADDSTAVKTLKGNAADVGIVISPVSPSMLTFATSPPATFIINASASDGAKRTILQWF